MRQIDAKPPENTEQCPKLAEPDVVDIGWNGDPADNPDAYIKGFSREGRFVLFTSLADNLVPNDTNREWDLFVRDRVKKITKRVPTGAKWFREDQEASMSSDGKYVVFESKSANHEKDLFLYDRQTHFIEKISEGLNGRQSDEGSQLGSISAEGGYVVFGSSATNLVPADTNGYADIFLFTRGTRPPRRISMGIGRRETDGDSFIPIISGNGRFVAFESRATNILSRNTFGGIDLLIHDTQENLTKKIKLTLPGGRISENNSGKQFSNDGSSFLFTTQNYEDDMDDQKTVYSYRPADEGIDVVFPNPHDLDIKYSGLYDVSMSSDGRFVAVSTLHEGEGIGYIVDRDEGSTRKVVFPDDVFNPLISGDGCFLVFRSRGNTKHYSARILIIGLESFLSPPIPSTKHP